MREEALQAGDEAMILASDGLWDVLSNQDAVNMIRDIPVRSLALPRRDPSDSQALHGRPVFLATLLPFEEISLP